MTNICRNCIHCTHEETDGRECFFWCELSQEYINERFAMDESIGCDGFVEELDDNETA